MQVVMQMDSECRCIDMVDTYPSQNQSQNHIHNQIQNYEFKTTHLSSCLNFTQKGSVSHPGGKEEQC
jgi:hypothetical protein